jgi:hypothetical protein
MPVLFTLMAVSGGASLILGALALGIGYGIVRLGSGRLFRSARGAPRAVHPRSHLARSLASTPPAFRRRPLL